MLTWKFELAKQEEYYKIFKHQLKREIYQELKYYVLPYMPVKFRGRVIFLPEKCDPQQIYIRQRIKLQNFKKAWLKELVGFENKISKYFPALKSVDVIISPSFYGSVGWYGFGGKKIIVRPRYDRRVIDVQKLVVNALTHYFYVTKKVNLDKNLWLKKQEKVKKIQAKIFDKEIKSRNIDVIWTHSFQVILLKKVMNIYQNWESITVKIPKLLKN